MSGKTDGGPAFPQSYRVPGCSTVVGESGLSIRDWFAGMALSGVAVSSLLNEPIMIGDREIPQRATPLDTTDIATWSYLLADAMLSERETTEG